MVKIKYKRGRVAYYFPCSFKRFLELGGTFKFNNRSWNFFRASIGTMSWEFHIVFDLRCFGPQHPKGVKWVILIFWDILKLQKCYFYQNCIKVSK